MTTTELADQVRSTILADPSEFRARVREEADVLAEEVEAGTFNNPQALVGMEYELYGVDDGATSLMRVPRQLLRYVGFEKELGLHNAEMHTSPQPLNRFGLRSQRTEIQARIDAALDQTRTEGIRLVSDGLWTVPPRGESAVEYLTDTVSQDGIRITPNMSDDPRYQSMSNSGYPARMGVDAPHADLSAETVLPLSLTASIQPHYQVPSALDLPVHFRYALRIAGPVLALGVNSPFLPPELYGDADSQAVLEDAWMETRIAVFESVCNPDEEGIGDKVRFPRDVTTVREAIDRIAGDEPIVPTRVEERGRFDDRYRHLQHKRGSYWRWIRPVFDAPTRTAANVRVEFRPLPAQPTVRDAVAFLALFAGLMESLPRRDHPVVDLDWETARENFYAAMRDGLDADVTWITADGERTTDPATIYEELFGAATDGLATRGIDQSEAATYLQPLRYRVANDVTPARWKRQRVRARLGDGNSLEEAIYGTQREYVERQAETLISGSFVEWDR